LPGRAESSPPRRYFEELDRRKGTPVDLCGDSFTLCVAGFAPMNLEATKQFAAMFFNALPDLSHPLDELIAEGDRVAFRCRYEATHTGAEFMGVQASGRLHPPLDAQFPALKARGRRASREQESAAPAVSLFVSQSHHGIDPRRP